MDDLASVWCEWAEMELQHKHFRKALDLMRRATTAPMHLDRRKVGSKPDLDQLFLLYLSHFSCACFLPRSVASCRRAPGCTCVRLVMLQMIGRQFS